MTGALLESGTLTEFEPLGTGGETLFGAAPELRAAIERRLGAEVAACFAVPQQNAYGDTLDWYAPERGPVTPWATLSDAQRAAVLEHIEALRRQVLGLSRALVGESRHDVRNFGRLLEHAATVPDESHLFLVGQRPVLAFWGFRRRGRNSNTLVPVGAKPIGREHADDKGTIAFAPPPPPGTPKRPGAAHRRWWWLLAAVLGLTLIAGLLWRILVPSCCAPPPSLAGPPTPHRPAATTEAPPEPLVLPPAAIASGSTDFLTGRWQASSDALVDSDSRLPLTLAYELDRGAGTVTVTEQSGSVCRASVAAAFTGETLTFTPRGEIRCPNRATFYGVTVTCRPSTEQRAVCTGRFPDGKAFHVALGRTP
ncbi:hypothetical protein [uncultured Thiodictyon sp.]|uniref:hypothetical protein n=1 Tax=uncultured Thiodictyon sp. TaxID=1846217 RepID=UPI0025D8C4E5|nr:hypothetical protein [uncultured Thiodictyon sp.]